MGPRSGVDFWRILSDNGLERVWNGYAKFRALFLHSLEDNEGNHDKLLGWSILGRELEAVTGDYETRQRLWVLL